MNLSSFEVLIIGFVGLAVIVGGILSVAGAGPAAVDAGVFVGLIWVVVWVGLRMKSRSDAMA